jgi:chemotaxis protein MotB
MDDHNTPVRIIVKKKKVHGGHHGGAWKVAYADFVTAMMALFIVLWIIGQSSNVKGAIAAYFKEPGVFKHTTNRTGGILDGSSGPIPARTETITGELEKLKLEGKKIEDAIAATPTFDRFKDKVQIQVTKDGLRIELVENSTGLFFDIGSARIKPEAIQLLKLVAKEIGRLPNSIIIEGYTDARPYETPNYSNWELSTDRANTARKILEENGVKKDQIIGVKGFADRNLKIPDKPFDFANRRVSILVEVQKQAAPDRDQKVRTPPEPGKK